MPQMTATPPLLLTPEEACAALRIHRSLLYSYLASGTLKSLKVGRLRRIRIQDLEDFVSRLAGEQGGEP